MGGEAVYEGGGQPPPNYLYYSYLAEFPAIPYDILSLTTE